MFKEQCCNSNKFFLSISSPDHLKMVLLQNVLLLLFSKGKYFFARAFQNVLLQNVLLHVLLF